MPKAENALSSFSGLVLIDKPAGFTSHDVVAKLRKILQTKAIGHTGTLDPMATGLMVMLVGEATKFSNYILQGDKAYEARLQLGVVTDSWDRTGQVLSEKPVLWDEARLRELLASMQGELDLAIPIYSAKKKDGKKLYEYARAGVAIDEIRKSMWFSDLECLHLDAENKQISVRLRCTKGGFIRSWAKEFGDRFGSGAHLLELRRIYSQPYRIEQAMSLEELSECLAAGQWPRAFVPMEECLQDWPELYVDAREEKLLRNGGLTDSLRSRVDWADRVASESGRWSAETRQRSGIKLRSLQSRKILALMVPKDEKSFKIARVFSSL